MPQEWIKILEQQWANNTASNENTDSGIFCPKSMHI